MENAKNALLLDLLLHLHGHPVTDELAVDGAAHVTISNQTQVQDFLHTF